VGFLFNFLEAKQHCCIFFSPLRRIGKRRLYDNQTRPFFVGVLCVPNILLEAARSKYAYLDDLYAAMTTRMATMDEVIALPKDDYIFFQATTLLPSWSGIEKASFASSIFGYQSSDSVLVAMIL